MDVITNTNEETSINRIEIIGNYGVFVLEQLQADINKFLRTLQHVNDLIDIKFFYYPSGYYAVIIYRENIEIANERKKEEELFIKNKQKKQENDNKEILQEIQKQKLEVIKLGKHKGRTKRVDSF